MIPITVVITEEKSLIGTARKVFTGKKNLQMPYTGTRTMDRWPVFRMTRKGTTLREWRRTMKGTASDQTTREL